MSHSPLGIYIHVPFCRTRCRYCDFYRVGENELRIERFLGALVREIDACTRSASASADSIFFGGGTPSLLSPQRIGELLRLLGERFSVTEGAEISLEANPSDLDRRRLDGYRHAGVNRLSLGAQSFSNRELRLLGRRHDAKKVRETFHAARRAGFDNLSLDLMLAVPGQTSAGLRATVETAVKLAPEHLSLYLLEVHQRSELDGLRRQRPGLFPGEEAQRRRYLWTSSRLEEAGYEHYEISNFCRPGRAARHNLKYWNCEETLGFGPAAHSLSEGRRWRHVADLERYIERPTELLEVDSDLAEERLFLGLRLRRGVEVGLLRSHLDLPRQELAVRLKELAAFVEVREGRIRLRREGRVVSTAVIGELLARPAPVERSVGLSVAPRHEVDLDSGALR